MLRRISRRAAILAFAALGRGAERLPVAPSEVRWYRDPATEFEVLRLTDPEKAACWLPQPPLRAITRGNDVFYCSDRSGKPQVWQMDDRSGESRQVTDASNLNPRTVSLLPNDRSIIYFDGPNLTVHQPRPRVVYRLDSGIELCNAFTVAGDGSRVALAERRGNRYRLRVIILGRGGGATTVIESDAPVKFVRLQPQGAIIAYGQRGALSLVNLDGRGGRQVKTPEGLVSDAQWSADGKLLHYLLAPPERSVQLREYALDTNEEKLVASTTQFVSFTPNRDSSVFAGVSANKGAPYILLLLRVAHRELTVAEHRASDPDSTVVVFSPNSQYLFYQTDRQGRPAIYKIALDRFVEKTDVTATSPLGPPVESA